MRGACVASGILVVLACVTPAREAEACSAGCVRTVVAPAPGGAVPSSAPAFALWSPSGPGGATPDVSLKAADGALIPVTVSAADDLVVVTPEAALAQGTYTMTGPADACAGEPVATTFSVGPAAPIPASFGAARVTSSGRATVPVPEYSGECSTGGRAWVVALAIDAAPELSPFSAVTRYVARVDGRVYAKSAFGGRGPAHSRGNSRLDEMFPRVDALRFDCASGPARHRIELTAELAGALWRAFSAGAPTRSAARRWRRGCGWGAAASGPS